jgi:hypothetical protein
LHGQQSFAREDTILRSTRPIKLLAAICFTLAASPALAQGAHPDAAHAISDLRAARDILSHPGQRGLRPEDQQAIRLIDAVITSTVRVARFDEQHMRRQEESGVDATTSGSSRHENARVLLTAALHDLDGSERDPQARPYLQQARYQLGEAIDIVSRGRGAQH